MTVGTLKERVMVTFAINTHFIRKRPAQAALTVLGLSGVVLVFLPFVYGEVPVDVLFESLEDLNLLGAALVGPCVVLPLFISVGYLRWLSTGGLSRWEGRLSYALALIVVALFSLSIIQTWWESGFDEDLLLIAFPALGLGAGAWFVIQNLRHRASRTVMALVALQLAYLPFALFWLAFPVGALIKGESMLDMPIGSSLTLLTVVVYTAQATLTVRNRPRSLLALLPLGVVWVSGVGWWTVGLIGGL
jgi:hypothetical protein